MVQALIGQFEQLALTAILALGEKAYGVTIHEAVGALAAPKTVSLGSVYATLDRLEEKGLIESWLSDPTPERGGRSKRHYRLQAAGARALRESVETSKRVCETVDGIWGALDGLPGRGMKPAGQH
jgi:DNA-binding PadR family transcriptional regulator